MKRYFRKAIVVGAFFSLSAALPLFAQQEAAARSGIDALLPATTELADRFALPSTATAGVAPFSDNNSGDRTALSKSEPCCAQSDVLVAELALPNAPSATDRGPDQDSSGSAGSFPAQKHSQGAIPAVRGPYLDIRVADWKYHALVGSMFASSITNAEITMRCADDHYCNFVPVPLRSRLALYGIGLPVDFGVAYYGYKLKKHGSSLWWVPSVIVTSANTYIALHSLHRINNKGF